MFWEMIDWSYLLYLEAKLRPSMTLSYTLSVKNNNIIQTIIKAFQKKMKTMKIV